LKEAGEFYTDVGRDEAQMFFAVALCFGVALLRNPLGLSAVLGVRIGAITDQAYQFTVAAIALTMFASRILAQANSALEMAKAGNGKGPSQSLGTALPFLSRSAPEG
jgi:hypothetical protein